MAYKRIQLSFPCKLYENKYKHNNVEKYHLVTGQNDNQKSGVGAYTEKPSEPWGSHQTIAFSRLGVGTYTGQYGTLTAKQLYIAWLLGRCPLQVLFGHLLQLPNPPQVFLFYSSLFIELNKLNPAAYPLIVSLHSVGTLVGGGGGGSEWLMVYRMCGRGCQNSSWCGRGVASVVQNVCQGVAE